MKDLVNFSIPSDKIVCDLMMDQIALSAVVVADEIDLFRALGDLAKDPETLAVELQTHRRSVEVLLNALTASGFITHQNSKYALNEISSTYLKKGSPTNRIFQFYSNKETWAYKRILNMMKHGPDPISQGATSFTSMWQDGTLTKEAADRFTAMMNTNIGGVMIALAKSGIFKEFDSVVDIGGASGIFLAAMRQLHPHKKLTLFELPQVCDSAKEILKHYIDPNSVEYFPASFFETNWPTGSQSFLLSNVLHDWTKEAGLKILKNIRMALPENGALFVNEALLDSGGLSPKHTVMFDLMMHLNHGSQQYTEPGITEMLKAAGFNKIRRVFEFGYYSTLRAE